MADVVAFAARPSTVWFVVQHCRYVDTCDDAALFVQEPWHAMDPLPHPPPVTRAEVTQLLRPDEQTAYLLDMEGGLAVTRDGETWVKRGLPMAMGPEGRGGSAILAADSPVSLWLDYRPLCTAACGAGSGVLYRSRDAGQTWQRVGPMPAARSSSLVAIDDRTAADETENGRFTTADGGLSWRSARTATSPGKPWKESG